MPYSLVAEVHTIHVRMEQFRVLILKIHGLSWILRSPRRLAGCSEEFRLCHKDAGVESEAFAL